MEGFTLIDGAVALVIVVSALLAYSRGFVREALAIAGWIGATILAFIFADQVEPLIRQIPVVGDFIGDSLRAVDHRRLRRGLRARARRLLDLHAALRGRGPALAPSAASTRAWASCSAWRAASCSSRSRFFVYDTVLSAQEIAMVENSRAAAIFSDWTGQIENQRPEEALGWITRQYEQLVGDCGAPPEPAEPLADPLTPPARGQLTREPVAGAAS